MRQAENVRVAERSASAFFV